METTSNNQQRIIIIETNNSGDNSNSLQLQSSQLAHQSTYELNAHNSHNQMSPSSYQTLDSVSLTKKCLLTSGFSSHIIQNYSILAQEIAAPLESIKPHQHQQSSQHSIISSSGGESNSSVTSSSSGEQSISASTNNSNKRSTWSNVKTRRIRDIKEDHTTNVNSLVSNNNNNAYEFI